MSIDEDLKKAIEQPIFRSKAKRAARRFEKAAVALAVERAKHAVAVMLPTLEDEYNRAKRELFSYLNYLP